MLAARGFDIVHVRGSGLTWREATKYLPAAMKRELEKARLGRTAAR